MGSGSVDLLVLDTHVWIWLVNGGPERLLEGATDVIRRASVESALAVSAISVWEVAMLESKGRLQLQMECLEWVAESTRRAGLRVLPLSPEIAVASTRLPGDPHGDPSDRIIVATARHESAILVTRDRALLGYAAQGYLRAIEA
ncbi:MAG: type II toxin-antitoxin system VapC family toxin [Pseudomonadota bacterium]|nr:type II toxin-antitoxin system VapC family toxin [Pseudomonadota bacterium]